MISSKKIRKELNKLRDELISEGINDNIALNEARKAMNNKYGKGWREKDYIIDPNLKMSYY